MKKLFQKISSMSKENKKYFAFLEEQFGTPLTWEQKVDAMQCRKAVVKHNKMLATKEKSPLAAKRPLSNHILRYGATALASIILSLSIALPIALSNRNSDKPPVYITIDPEKKHYTDEVVSMRITETALRNMKDFLLFSEVQTFIDHGTTLREDFELIYGPLSENDFKDLLFAMTGKTREEFIFKWGNAYVEHFDNIILSYAIKDLVVLINGEDEFLANYRIRTYKDYSFVNFVEWNYHALETVASNHGNEVSDSIKLFTITEDVVVGDQVIGTMNKAISAFIVDDIAIYCITSQSGFSSATLIDIHFTYKSNDYFIRIDDSNLDSAVTLDVNYVKDVFIPALFQNIPGSVS